MAATANQLWIDTATERDGGLELVFVVAALPFENDLPSIDAARLTGFSGYSNGINRGSKQTRNT